MAQNNDEAFQQRAFGAAGAEAGDARIPILCGGLYQALTVPFANDTEFRTDLIARQDVARNIGTVVHLMDTAGTGVELEEAEAFMDARFTAVSAAFTDWMALNVATGQNPVSDRVGDDYRFCDGHRTSWTTTPAN